MQREPDRLVGESRDRGGRGIGQVAARERAIKPRRRHQTGSLLRDEQALRDRETWSQQRPHLFPGTEQPCAGPCDRDAEVGSDLLLRVAMDDLQQQWLAVLDR